MHIRVTKQDNRYCLHISFFNDRPPVATANTLEEAQEKADEIFRQHGYSHYYVYTLPMKHAAALYETCPTARGWERQPTAPQHMDNHQEVAILQTDHPHIQERSIPI